MAEVSVYDALFKQRFGKLVNLLPEVAKLQKMLPFITKDAPGGEFIEAVNLDYAHGFTLGGNDASPALRKAVSYNSLQAKITPSQIIGREVIGYRDLFRTDGAGNKAFADAGSERIVQLTLGARRNIEISIIHGQNPNGLGKITAADNAAKTVTIDPKTWATGLWVGSKNMPVNIVQADGVTVRVAALKVVTFDKTTKKITLVNEDDTAPNLGGVLATDLIVRDTTSTAGARKDAVGLMAIAANAGVLFNIDAAANPLWKVQQYDVGNVALSFGAIVEAAEGGVEFGLEGDLVALIPIPAFAPLARDEAALRAYDTSYKPNEGLNGVKSLKFHYQNGSISIVPHPYMHAADGLLIPVESDMAPEDRSIRRLGSKDLTFNLPGPDGDQPIFRHLDQNAGHEIRCYTDQCVLARKPSRIIRLQNIG